MSHDTRSNKVLNKPIMLNANMERTAKIAISVIIVVIVVVAGYEVINSGLHKTPVSVPTIVVASSATPSSIDPAVAFDTASVLFPDQIYNTLIDYGTTTFNGQKVGALNPVPGLATSWTVATNGSVTFNLRQNVTFSNGDPFNASVVQFSLDRVITMNQGPAFHVRQFLNTSGIHVLGKYKVMLVPSAPYPWFLDLFQLWVTGITDPLYVNAHGGVVANQTNTYMADHAMGTGPYELSNYSQSKITLVANPNFWGPKPAVQKIIYDVVNSPATQQTLLQQGSVNLALNIPLDQMSTVKNYSNVQVKAGPTSSEYYIGLDENMTPFKNLSVRKAMEYALNTTQITKYSTFGYGVQIESAMSPTIEAYTPAFKNYTYNLTMAKYYLNQASSYLEKNKANISYNSATGAFTTSFYYISGDPVGTAIATMVQSQLKQLNITVNLKEEVSGTFFAQNGLGIMPMFFDGWVNLLATPDDGLRPLFNAANLGIYGNYNYFNNTTVSNDLVTAGQTLNKSVRDPLYVNAQNIIAQQAVEVPLFNEQNVIPMTSNVQGLLIYPTFDIFFNQTSLS